MNSTGQNNDKASYRIILLLVVGLTAFSSAMKELNQIQQLSLDASRLMAQWSGTIVPVDVPQTPQPPLVVKAESCELKQSTPSVELPWLTHVAKVETSEIEETEAPVAVKRSSSRGDVVKVKRVRSHVVDPVQFEVRIPSVHEADVETLEIVVPEVPVTSFSAVPFKFKTRKNGSFRINTRDREMLLKTFNRSISVRSAG
ncbi:MAG TPA: hypothetical protein VFT44_04540 [Pyrinomonadaceae bacterium]|nr:hypothetical protein [Pyrinomonadaceae bacterium]